MKVGIQFNSYDGMGGKVQVTYRIGYITLNQKNKSGTVYCESIYDLPEIKFGFNLTDFEITDSLMVAKGTNKEGYGKVDMCFDVNSSCWNLAMRDNERARLEKIYKDTPRYYKSSFGDIKDINKAVDKIMRGNRE